jgi:hypothetical protein
MKRNEGTVGELTSYGIFRDSEDSASLLRDFRLPLPVPVFPEARMQAFDRVFVMASLQIIIASVPIVIASCVQIICAQSDSVSGDDPPQSASIDFQLQLQID